MSLKELKKYLTHRVPFPDREFDALMKKGKELRFKARMPIIKTGDVDENVYIVRDGMVRGVFFANGRENTIYFAFPGDFVASTASLSLGLPAQITMEAFFRDGRDSHSDGRISENGRAVASFHALDDRVVSRADLDYRTQTDDSGRRCIRAVRCLNITEARADTAGTHQGNRLLSGYCRDLAEPPEESEEPLIKENLKINFKQLLSNLCKPGNMISDT